MASEKIQTRRLFVDVVEVIKVPDVVYLHFKTANFSQHARLASLCALSGFKTMCWEFTPAVSRRNRHYKHRSVASLHQLCVNMFTTRQETDILHIFTWTFTSIPLTLFDHITDYISVVSFWIVRLRPVTSGPLNLIMEHRNCYEIYVGI